MFKICIFFMFVKEDTVLLAFEWFDNHYCHLYVHMWTKSLVPFNFVQASFIKFAFFNASFELQFESNI